MTSGMLTNADLTGSLLAEPAKLSPEWLNEGGKLLVPPPAPAAWTAVSRTDCSQEARSPRGRP
jgi:hypothetical protein